MIFEKYIPEPFYYRIKPNESIVQVADKFNTNLENIECMSVAGLNEGEFLLIKQCNQGTHIVKPLEDISMIAKKYGVTEEHIVKVNNLKSKRLFVGQKIRY